MQELSKKLACLTVFRGLLKQPIISSLIEYVKHPSLDRYCELVSLIYQGGGDLGSIIRTMVLESENPAVLVIAKGQTLSMPMSQTLLRELETFSWVTRLTPQELAGDLWDEAALPLFESTSYDLATTYTERLGRIHSHGYGIFARHHMFTVGDGGELCPVKNPDPQRLSELEGYERERSQVSVNTQALLNSLPANNILLYGDAGTGKSSTVKAIANEYYKQGLRLIEVRKNQIYHIAKLMDTLADNPLKFILFIDDLSFASGDGDFTALKAILEGNVSTRPSNIVVYATSNRRHMIKEQMADRMGGDLSRADTLQEESSLADRFGLTITFLRPDKDLYLAIIRRLALENDLETPLDDLFEKAEAHAIRHGGRTPRTAKQFIEFTKVSESCLQQGGTI